ncbi:MAG: SPOR domain-containing protein [Chromatiales bacterium]|nr:SPOR domain-containing protein [Chromatiales bacterium]
MDRRLLERMIGGVVLLAVLALVVPAILGRGTQYQPEPPAALPDLRTHTITLERDSEQPPVAQPMAPPVAEPAPEPVIEPLPEPVPPPAESPPRAPPPPADPSPPARAAAPPALPPPPPRAAPPAAPPPAPAAPATARLAEQQGWVVQLGSFSSEANANRLLAEVRGKGFEVWLLPLKRNGETLYRVRVGPPGDSRDQAESLATRLAREGHRGQVVRQ